MTSPLKMSRVQWVTLNFILGVLVTFSASSAIGKFGKMVSDITIVPSGYQFKEVGSKIVFTCIIGEHLLPGGEGGGMRDWPIFKWKDPNQALILGDQNRIYSERMDAHKSKMYITRVEENDAGLYTCEVLTKEGLMVIASNNLFIYADIHFRPSPTRIEAMLGSSPLLECEAVGNPQPDISWKFNGKKIPKDGRFEMEKKGLRIRRVEIEDSGTYECRAQVISQGNFKNLKVTLVVLYAPILNLPLYSPRVVSGKDAKLECQASGNPPVTYEWFKGNPKSRMSLYRGQVGAYILREVTKDDEGEYTCVVDNKFGMQQGTVDLRVSVPPKVKVPEEVISVMEGAQLVLPCEASSSPVASFRWSKRRGGDKHGGHQSNKTTERWSVMTSDVGVSKLRIEAVTKDDTGNFTCTATNEAGTDSKDVKVLVDFVPKVTLTSPPEVYAWSGLQRILTCVAVGHPPPSVAWIKNHSTYLGSTPHHIITTTKDLTGTQTTNLTLVFDEQLETSMYSNYSCSAKNIHGFETKTVDVRKAYRPDLPRNVSVVNVTYDSFSLKTSDDRSAPNDPSIPPTTHWVVKYKKSKPSFSLPTHPPPHSIKGTEFVVTRFDAGKPLRVEGLETDTEYLVLVAAGNVVGESGTVKFNVQTAKFHEDELFQADQGLMSRSSLSRQEHLRLTKHMDDKRRRFKSFWDSLSVGIVVVVAGLLTVVTTVVLALAFQNWRKNSPATSGTYRIGSPAKERGHSGVSDFDRRGQRVTVADEHDIDSLTMKTIRPRTSVNDDSPFADLQSRYGSLPRKFNDSARSIRPFDVANNNNSNNNSNGSDSSNVGHHHQQQQQLQLQLKQGEKAAWPMSSTLPRSKKMEVHVNRTASVMEMIEERKKTKQSQAWKDMMKLTTADLDEDSMLSRDDEEEEEVGYKEEDSKEEDEGVFEEGSPPNLPPPPSDMLPSPVKSAVTPQQFAAVQAVKSNVNVNCRQAPFDPSHANDDDEDISFIDDDDEDDVIVTHHCVPGGAGKKVHFEGKSFKQY